MTGAMRSRWTPRVAATVAGQTVSSNFPTTAGAYDTSHNGLADAFVARLSASGNVLLYSTYVGGGSDDWANDVGLDATGAAIVAGRTSSTDFPTTVGAYDTGHNGLADAFIARLSPSRGCASVFDVHWRSGSDDWANAMAVDTTGAVTLAGQTESLNFPTTPGAYDTSPNGYIDGFVNAAGTRKLSCLL